MVMQVLSKKVRKVYIHSKAEISTTYHTII